MKTTKIMKTIAVAGLLLLSTSSWSLTINGGTTNVGSVDKLLASANAGGTTDAEKTWVEGVLGFAVVVEYEKDSMFNWTAVDNSSSIFAQELSTNPDYFVVKLDLGDIQGLLSHHLFKNIYDLSYAVINLAQLAPRGVTIDIGRVTKLTEINKVPEPGSLVLLGIGLLGLGLLRNKKKVS